MSLRSPHSFMFISVFSLYLSELAFGAGSLSLRGPQGSNIHLLGLFPHLPLVSSHGLHDEPVSVDDDAEGQSVDEDGVSPDVGNADPVGGQVVSSAGSHVTLWDISVGKEK